MNKESRPVEGKMAMLRREQKHKATPNIQLIPSRSTKRTVEETGRLMAVQTQAVNTLR
jgi:hypothetical protein